MGGEHAGSHPGDGAGRRAFDDADPAAPGPRDPAAGAPGARTDADAETDDAGLRLLRALLAIDPGRARDIRTGTARPRPRPQTGPSADYGD